MALFLMGSAGCPLAHDGVDTTSCESDKDCFRPEYCEGATADKLGVCRSRVPDSGTPDRSLIDLPVRDAPVGEGAGDALKGDGDGAPGDGGGGEGRVTDSGASG